MPSRERHRPRPAAWTPPRASQNDTTANRSGAFLQLVRSVERNVPSDVAQARHELDALNLAVKRHARHPCATMRGASTEHVWIAADRFHVVLERVVHDLAGGHVLAVNGLELPVRGYFVSTQSDASAGRVEHTP